ncbi:MAG: hypothetical protein AB7F98_04860 [Novosphingobium sp.]
MAACAFASPVSAYIGDSFLSIPGESGHWRGKEHKGWVHVEASDWDGRIMVLNSGATDPLAGDKLYFGGPNAAQPGRGGGKLTIALNVDNPDARLLARLCADKTVAPEMTYSESSDRARPVLELGARPKQFPAWWRYTLKSVEVVDCPVLEGAVQRAFVLKFGDIAWLNYDPDAPRANRIVVKPEDLPPVTPRVPEGRKQVRAWLITWIAPATTTTDEQCPRMNGKPTEEDVYRYLSPAEQEEVRKRFRGKGISYGFDSERRGPHRLNATVFPGIVPDPGLFEPVTTVADGLDLDGDEGSGKPPRGIRKHANFTSPDGRTGIDNQLIRVMGCVPGFRGRRGYSNQTPNARRADGNITTLIEVSDIDDDRNDGHVEVALIHSMDKPMRDTFGKTFIAGYTFRPTTDPNFALYNVRVRGRIVDGVILTDPVDLLQFNPGQGALTEFYKARFRIEQREDGTAKTILGGYQKWKLMNYSSGYSEGLFGFRAESIFYGLRRHADGLRNPLTGEYEGISVAYEIDTVPAFLTPLPATQLAAGKADGATGDARANR